MGSGLHACKPFLATFVRISDDAPECPTIKTTLWAHDVRRPPLIGFGQRQPAHQLPRVNT